MDIEYSDDNDRFEIFKRLKKLLLHFLRYQNHDMNVPT